MSFLQHQSNTYNEFTNKCFTFLDITHLVKIAMYDDYLCVVSRSPLFHILYNI